MTKYLQRIFLAGASVTMAIAWTGPAAANHDGLFDITSPQQEKRVAASQAVADDTRWLARFRSWLRNAVTDDYDAGTDG